ncbi:ABC transporter substrate-binding protein [Nocardia panacis]|uniref:ABC transporter substrate-binding protein n=1 Tax=Nocardia panacis TaxID=2340916 RepID=A0A3A4KF18_9NOCA|nr:ABC transporter substrate-binding protein [Nocardia panacis]RJO72566.1 ABC transporter substrate-binding protein [Nocardia panacis]
MAMLEAVPEVETNRPRRGGTLTLVGAGDVDHLDPALAYHTATRGILRAYTRQLVGYVASRDRTEAGRIVADMATEVPTVANGRIRGHGTEYRFTLRDGLRWCTPTGPRAMTAGDVVRGIKRLAHPLASSPGLAYYVATIAGMAEYRDLLAATPPGAIADRIADAEVRGLRAEGDSEIICTTSYPASDFLNMLALPFATPAPVEYLDHIPGSPELNAILAANGPYRVTRYLPGESIVLERNPFWDPTTDPLRAAHVDAIEIREGLSERRAHDMVGAAEADMMWDIQPLTEELPPLLASDDPRLEVCPAGLFSPYLVLNFASPVLADRDIRVALQYAVDKAAVARVWGGPRLNDIADQILPPLCTAHREFHPYGTAGGRGDPERARRLLAAAGYPEGLTLRLIFRDRDIHPDTAREIRDAMARANIRVELVGVSINELFSDYFSGGNDRWDMALTGWEPDWYGNNARTYLQPLFDSRGVGPDGDWGANFGRYRSAKVNDLLGAALTAADASVAGELFRQVEVEVLRDAAVVPILFAHQYWWHATTVRNWLPYPVLNGDPTNLWLADPRE